MIPAYAMSWAAFCETMKNEGLTDFNIEQKDRAAVIEVMGAYQLDKMPFYFKEDHPNVLRLVFDDVEENCTVIPDGQTEEYRAITMSEEHAKKIVDFIKANKEVFNFIIHCAAGKSRSASIAKFIMEYTNERGIADREFNLINPQANVKAGFMKTLREAAQKKIQ